jgi:hypothetical protein
MFTRTVISIAIAACAGWLILGGDATARGSFRGPGLASSRPSGNVGRWHGTYRNGSHWRHHLDRRNDHDGRRHADEHRRFDRDGRHADDRRRSDRDHDGHHRRHAMDGHWHRSTGFGHHSHHSPGTPGEWHKTSGFGGKDNKNFGAMGEWHKTPSGFAPEWRAKD